MQDNPIPVTLAREVTLVEIGAGLVVSVREDGVEEFLLVQRRQNGRRWEWDLPGGEKLKEKLESFELCLEREVARECGFTGVRARRLIARCYHADPAEKLLVEKHIYLVTEYSGAIDFDRNTGLKRFSLSELSGLKNITPSAQVGVMCYVNGCYGGRFYSAAGI